MKRFGLREIKEREMDDFNNRVCVRWEVSGRGNNRAKKEKIARGFEAMIMKKNIVITETYSVILVSSCYGAWLKTKCILLTTNIYHP